MGATIYIITEIGWDYDDKYYYRSGNAGNPVEAYTLKELAEEAALNKEIAFVKDLLSKGDSVTNLYRTEEEIDPDDHREWILECKERYNISFDEYMCPYVEGKRSRFGRNVVPVEADNQFFIDYISHLGLSFFEVVQVDFVA